MIFPVDRFEDVAGIMKPRKRRQVSDAERKRLAVMGAKFRFTPGAQTSQTAQICVPSTRGDSENPWRYSEGAKLPLDAGEVG